MIDDLVKQLDAALNAEYERYLDLNKELDKHRGHKLDDTNQEEVRRLVQEIQDSFLLMYPAYNFIGYRYQPTVNLVNAYTAFIDQLKRAEILAESNRIQA